VAFVVGVEWRWLALDPLPDLTGDDAGVARLVFGMLAHWRDGTPYNPAALAGAPYPPLAVQLGALGAWAASSLGGDPILGMLRGQSVYLVMLVLGAWLALRRDLGVAAALAGGLLAPVYGWWAYRGQLFLDMQLGACFVAAVGAWTASDGLRRPAYALGFGAALAAALSTKFSAVFFAGLPAAAAVGWVVAALSTHPARGVAGLAVVGASAAAAAAAAGVVAPAAVVGAIALAGCLAGWTTARAAAEGWRARLVGLLLAGLGLSLAAPWYLGHLAELRLFFARNLGGEFDGAVLPVGDVWWVYPSVLFRGAVDELVSGLALVGLLRVRRQGARGPGWLAAAMVVSGLVCLTLQPYRTPRYIVPAAGLVVVLAVASLGWLARARVPAAVLLGLGAAWLWFGSLTQRTPRFDADRSVWWNRVVWVPPNALETLSQLRAAAVDRQARLHDVLPGPTPAPPGLARLADAAAERLDLARVDRVETAGGLPPTVCRSIALLLVVRGADPYLACDGGGTRVVRVAPAAGAPTGLVTAAGPFDVQGLYVHAAPALLRAGAE
jgi:hypothetical protein